MTALGPEHSFTIHVRGLYGLSLYANKDASLDDLILAETTLEENSRTARHVLGRGHPTAVQVLKDLVKAREKLARVRANPQLH